MKELDQGLSIALTGMAAEKVKTAFYAQMREWGVALPPNPLLILDFGLNEFDRVGLVESWICNETEAGYCGKYLFVFDGQSCPRHQHKKKHETFFVVHGNVRMNLDGEEQDFEPGSVIPVGPGVTHGFTGIGPVLLLELSKPCFIADNFSPDGTPLY